MRQIFSAATPMQKLQRQFVRACIGPFTIVDVMVGWSPTIVGQMKGRIDVPGAGTGYLFLDVKFLNKQLVLCCWQLA